MPDTVVPPISQKYSELISTQVKQISELLNISPMIPQIKVRNYEGAFDFETIVEFNSPRLRIACGRLNQFPGNCGMVVINNLMVTDSYRGKGVGKILVKILEDIAAIGGYTIALATTNQGCVAANHIFEKHANYQKIDTLAFTNARTQSKITTWIKNIREEKSKK